MDPSKNGANPASSVQIVYNTRRGKFVLGQAEDVLVTPFGKRLTGKVDLIFTSPPFPLNRKKKYGNRQGPQYIEWLAGFAAKFKALLKPKGSIVIELGNAWEPGKPIMSTLALRALLAFVDNGS